MASLVQRKEAYVTMVTSDNFLPGVEALLESIREQQETLAAENRRVIMCLVSKSVSPRVRSKIESRGGTILEVPSIGIPASSPSIDLPASEQRSENKDSKSPASGAAPTHVASWVATGYTKLNLWRLGQEEWGGWEAVLYIDADAIVLEDLSPLFGRLDSANPLIAAPDVFPPDRFNAGVLGLWLDRDGATLADMLRQLERLGTYDGNLSAHRINCNNWTLRTITHLATVFLTSGIPFLSFFPKVEIPAF